MPSHFVSSNFFTGRKKTVLHEENHQGEIIIENTYDATDLIELNKATLAQVSEKARWGDGDLVARIPPAIYWSLPKHIREDDDAFLAWLDHPDQRAFRTRLGSLSR